MHSDVDGRMTAGATGQPRSWHRRPPEPGAVVGRVVRGGAPGAQALDELPTVGGILEGNATPDENASASTGRSCREPPTSRSRTRPSGASSRSRLSLAVMWCRKLTASIVTAVPSLPSDQLWPPRRRATRGRTSGVPARQGSPIHASRKRPRSRGASVDRPCGLRLLLPRRRHVPAERRHRERLPPAGTHRATGQSRGVNACHS